ncbi:hypothetical protein [Leptothoe sp. PORK10 BA2]|uniref:hypothetical protein n=1 Tax=Leptothoe sp. PORK10 BA2 TaxID=3110254 RepID=UPI002B1F4758|nr:hypothetical protein [Leptothoe sp. PORK10 BA2]MEA5466563.1 hypothetical protein [Leptothoe sp. PORK10 BA2]
MSSADSRPPDMTNSVSERPANESDASVAADSNPPALKKPPRRPVKPDPVEEPLAKPAAVMVEAPAMAKVATAPAVVEATAATAEERPPAESEPAEPQPRLQPISPPSEPMQYRAIGLLKGRYEPSEESFNRGNIVNHDGSTTCAVLLGRTTSLVKKHLDLEKDHLWVVYPRTIFQDDIGIAVQIVGVWEPETLGEDEEEPVEAPDDAIKPDYFSIRGEVIKFDERKQEITVSIVQKMRTGKQPKRPFKLVINGSIGVKTIGYFWDMHVYREGNQFVLNEGSYVGAVPPKKRSEQPPQSRRPPSGGNSFGAKRRPAKRSGAPRPKPNLAKGEDGEKPTAVTVAEGNTASTTTTATTAERDSSMDSSEE